MGDILRKITGFVTKITEYLGVIMIVLLTLSLFGGVLARYIFSVSIPELQVLTNFSVFWLVFLGSALAIKENVHLEIDIFNDYLSNKAIQIKNRIVYILVLAAIIILIIVGIEAWQVGLTRRELITIRFLDSQPNLLYYYSSILAGSVLMLFFHLRSFRETFLKKEGEKE